MRITSMIRSLSKEKCFSSKLPPNYCLPWQRAFCTGIGESGFRVKVTSREMIKPSSPTPSDKRTLQLSLIDQLATNCQSPMLLFYQNDPLNNKERKTSLLKKSLSEILVDFYPLAGRIHRNELINCGDQGVEFSEAHYSENLDKFLENPSLSHLHELLPFKDMNQSSGSTPRHKNIALSVQVNHFPCGGMDVAVCHHHKVADATACIDFLTAWAAKTQGVYDTHTFRPKFSGASLFPPVKELNEPMTLTEDLATLLSKERIAMRRVTFDKKAIDELKAQAIATDSTTTRPSKVEVVTALMFKLWPKKMSSIVQVVNMRKRMVPAMEEGFFGNCSWFARTSEYPEATIHEFRKGIQMISGNYMKEFLSAENFLLRLQQEMGSLFDKPGEFLLCNGLSGSSLNEINFGLGKPVWACYPMQPVKNVLFTMSTKCGQGIDAWVMLLEEDVSTFDRSLSQLGYPSVVMPIQIIG